MHRRSGQLGVSLVESMLAMVILSVALVGVLQAVYAGQAQTGESLHAMRAMHLAGSLMERVLSGSYDQALAYDGFTQEPGQIADASDQLLAHEYQVFSRQVQCAAHNLAVTGLGDPIPGLVVVVTIEDQRGQHWHLHRFIAEDKP